MQCSSRLNGLAFCREAVLEDTTNVRSPRKLFIEHPLSFCFCIKKMLLLSSRRLFCYFVATTMKHEQFIILSVLCKHVMYWDVTKPQTHLSVSCAFHVYLLLIRSPRDPHLILPSPRRFSLPNKGPLPNSQGQGIHLKVASQTRKRQTQVVQGSGTGFYW